MHKTLGNHVPSAPFEAYNLCTNTITGICISISVDFIVGNLYSEYLSL